MQREIHDPLPMRHLRRGAICRPPWRHAAKPVRFDSPAIETMTDLRNSATATIGANATVHQANQVMIAWGVRLLLVVGANCLIEGLITARDTMGEKPLKLLRERGGKHAELTVADLMIPRDAIEVLDIAAVEHAEVGHLIATLKEVGRQHALVVDRDRETGEEYVRGIFSVTQIGRQLGVNIPIFEVAHTFAEIEAQLAR